MDRTPPRLQPGLPHSRSGHSEILATTGDFKYWLAGEPAITGMPNSTNLLLAINPY
jgi:hypothetical protein